MTSTTGLQRHLLGAALLAIGVVAMHLAALLSDHHDFMVVGAVLAPLLATATVVTWRRLDSPGVRSPWRVRVLRDGPIVCLLTLVYLAAEWPERELGAGHFQLDRVPLEHWLPVLVSAGVALYWLAVLQSLGALMDYLRVPTHRS